MYSGFYNILWVSVYQWVNVSRSKKFPACLEREQKWGQKWRHTCYFWLFSLQNWHRLLRNIPQWKALCNKFDLQGASMFAGAMIPYETGQYKCPGNSGLLQLTQSFNLRRSQNIAPVRSHALVGGAWQWMRLAERGEQKFKPWKCKFYGARMFWSVVLSSITKEMLMCLPRRPLQSLSPNNEMLNKWMTAGSNSVGERSPRFFGGNFGSRDQTFGNWQPPLRRNFRLGLAGPGERGERYLGVIGSLPGRLQPAAAARAVVGHEGGRESLHRARVQGRGRRRE